MNANEYLAAEEADERLARRLDEGDRKSLLQERREETKKREILAERGEE